MLTAGKIVFCKEEYTNWLLNTKCSCLKSYTHIQIKVTLERLSRMHFDTVWVYEFACVSVRERAHVNYYIFCIYFHIKYFTYLCKTINTRPYNWLSAWEGLEGGKGKRNDIIKYNYENQCITWKEFNDIFYIPKIIH